jgi:hypothetical protein
VWRGRWESIVRANECAGPWKFDQQEIKNIDLFVTRWPTAIIFTLRSSAIYVTELGFAFKLWDAYLRNREKIENCFQTTLMPHPATRIMIFERVGIPFTEPQEPHVSDVYLNFI